MSVQILALSYTKKLPQCWVMPIVILGAVLTVLVMQSCKVLLHAIFLAPRTRGTQLHLFTQPGSRGELKHCWPKKPKNNERRWWNYLWQLFLFSYLQPIFAFIKRHAPLISLHAVTVHDFFTHVCVNDTPLQAFYSRDKSRYSLLVWLWTPDSLMCSSSLCTV